MSALRSVQAVEHLPPHSLESEQALLGSVLIDRDAIIPLASLVSPCDFYSAANGEIWQAMRELYRRKVPADLTTVSAELERYGRLETVGGINYLSSLLTAVPHSIHAQYYANVVREHGMRRRLIQVGQEIIREAYKYDSDPEVVVQDARNRLAKVVPTDDDLRIRTLAEATDWLAEDIERREDADYIPDVIQTGFYDLDRALTDGGFLRKQLVVLGGRPGSGKTAMALQVALNAARYAVATQPDPEWIMIFSSEMTTESLVWRALAEASGINGGILRSPRRWTDEQRQRVQSRINDLSELPIVIDDSSAPTVQQMQERIEQFKMRHPVRMAIFDHIERSGKRNGGQENEVTRIGEIAKGLKSLAKDSDITMLALSQLNREVEKRSNRQPTLSDLRQSGEIEAEADIVLGLYRHDYYVNIGLERPDKSREGIAEVSILKQRDGQQTTVKLAFLPELTAFRSLDRSAS